MMPSRRPTREAARTSPARPIDVPGSVYPQHDIEIDGCRIRYVDVGPIAPDDPTRTGDARSDYEQCLPLVVLPGHTARIEGFDAMMPQLSARRRVLVLDFPGSGYSDHPDRDYTLKYYEDTAIAFLDALGVTTAIPVGGSLGGNLVLRLGHRFPERFPRLVVWAPGSAWQRQAGLARLTRRFAGIALFWPSVWIQSRFWYGPDHPGRAAALAETFAYYREVMGPGFVRMYWGIAADQLDHSLFDIAGEVRQRTLLMWGTKDNGAKMGAGVARLHALLPNDDFHVFEGARHSLEAEIPDLLARTIIDFVDR